MGNGDVVAAGAAGRAPAVGTHLFCSACGDLLRIHEKEREAKCTTCEMKVGIDDFLDVRIVEESGPRDWQRKYGVHPIIKEKPELEKEVEQKRQIVEDHCPKCGHKGLEFYTLQLRSADEGQTVFYECPKCQHK
eukprot:CAMPEP_0197477460 /NCGR_PEP_ID=MMETSP1309-20131121/17177_1 /TAXON_ID=464262 /ORGANISM="Genus nov. species nov., Strain RCC998" /LENGTH=133 /DNA_ID=CAMNT_0043018415 /DNA_START=94 /DNA_END=492 /DNA_ORIENTATION=+